MIEVATSVRVRQAYQDAHKERGMVLVNLGRWIKKVISFPLGVRVLTETPR